MVKLLIEKGAVIDAKNKDGKTALAMAHRYGQADVVRYLKTYGHKKEKTGKKGVSTRKQPKQSE